MRITVDKSMCEGHNQCFMTDEALFPIDETGHSAIPDGGQEVPAGKEALAESGVDGCPEMALELEKH